MPTNREPTGNEPRQADTYSDGQNELEKLIGIQRYIDSLIQKRLSTRNALLGGQTPEAAGMDDSEQLRKLSAAEAIGTHFEESGRMKSDANMERAMQVLESFDRKISPSSSVEQLIKDFDDATAEAQRVVPEGQQGTMIAESNNRLFRYGSEAALLKRLLKGVNAAIAKKQGELLSHPDRADAIAPLESWQDVATHLEQSLEDDLPYVNREAFIAHNLLKIRELKREFAAHHIMSTGEVHAENKKISEKLAMRGIAAMLGETGTGKTQRAIEIATQYHYELYPNDESAKYHFVAGHKFTDKTDLLGYLGLNVQRFNALDVVQQVKEITEETRRFGEKEGWDDDEMEESIAIAQATVKGQGKESQLVTEKFLGPIQKAMEEGKILIIDEFNYIDPGLFASLNQYLQAKPGDSVAVNGHSITVQEGFGVILTGNISLANANRYLNRHSFDPALVSRIGDAIVEVGTPPLDDIDTGELESGYVKEGKRLNGEHQNNKRDLYQILLATLCDEKGNLYAPESINGRTTLEAAWKLSLAFKVLQNNYAGKPLRPEDTYNGAEFPLKITYPSMRTVIDMVENWKADGFQYDIEHYIVEYLIKPASILAPQEAQYMYHIFWLQEFFRDPKWDGVLQKEPSPTGVEELHLKPYRKDQFVMENRRKMVYQPSQVAEAFSGYEAPTAIYATSLRGERATEKTTGEAGYQEAIERFTQQIEDIKQRIENYNRSVEFFCEDERNILGEGTAA